MTDLPAVLLDLAVPHEDIDRVVAQASAPDPELLSSLVREMGSVDVRPSLPEFEGYQAVYLFVAALPHVQAYHRALGIPEEISRRTLADLGRNMAVHRKRYGTSGLSTPKWLTCHFRGTIYQLGRLQFERDRLGTRTGNAIAAAGLPYGPGDRALSVHIPDFSGPLTPQACDHSFAYAKTFFPRYFPEEEYGVAVCHSWLLDDQLAEYLPADSNIVRFQRRFRPAYRPEPDDEVIQRFVFGPVPSTPDALPRRTTLEQAVADHLVAGRHWHGGAGWLPL